MHVFLGITGASGAPYAARLLEALSAADCEIGVCASLAGVEVLATELYGNAKLSRDETLARLLEHAPNATLYEPNDWKAPYASGSAGSRLPCSQAQQSRNYHRGFKNKLIKLINR